MSLKIDKVQLEIIMKSDTARAEIIKLEDVAKSLKKEMVKLKNDPGELAKKSAEYDKVTARIKELKNSIHLTGMTMRELQEKSKLLSLQLRNLTPGGEKFRELDNELRQVNARMRELRGQAQGTQSGLSNLANGFNKYFALATSFIAGITGASLAFRKLAEDVAHMDDVYSDVMKTTQMTRDEVVLLNEEFKKIDTRTSREELNKIAEAGGRIGVTKDKVLEFTKAMDIANVALGDSFTGGVEEISTKLGKLKFLFSETKDMKIEQAYLSIASSINELGANGAASEANIAEFTTRVGSMQVGLKPAIADALALGAAFEESGMEAEVSSRAYSIVLSRATTDTAKFAKVMGMSTKEVEDLINTNALEFFLQFSESMKGLSATDAGKVLDDLKVNADGANKAIGAVTNNTDRFRELIELSNKSFKEGTSVINEYNIKNNNLAARLDKAKKAFQETALELGERLNPMLLTSVKGTTYLIKALVELPKWLRENAVTLGSLAFTWGVYTIAVNASTIASKLSVFWNEKVIVSFNRISAAMKANPWVFIATGVILALTWLNKYLKKQQEINVEQQKFNDLAQKSKELFSETKTLEDRAKAMKTLSKTQLESLQSDLETQIDAMGKFDAEVKTRAQKAISEDAELIRLKKKNAEAKTAIEKQATLAPIKWREEALLNEMANEYLKNKQSLRGLENYLKNVKALIKKQPKTTNDYTPTPDKDKTDPFTEALKIKEDAYKESQLELMEQRRLGQITEETYNQIALQTQLTFLEEKKKLQEKFKKDTIDTEIEISNQKLKIGQDADKFSLEAIKKQEEAGIKVLESGEQTKQQMLQDALSTNLISENEYNLEIKKLAVELNSAKLALAKAGLEALAKVSFNDKELQKKALEDAKAEIEKLQAELLKAQGEVAKEIAKGVEKATETTAERMRSIFGDSFSDIGDMFGSFIDGLDKLKSGDLKSWTDWGTAIGSIIQTSLAVATRINDQYYEYKGAALEADKQRELTNAGDSADQRDAINKKYAQKELDLKKKQSSSDTVLKVAQAISAGGLAIVQAFAQLGPIGGAIAAILIGGITGLQVGTIMKQNAAIQATTLDSSTSGGSLNTGASTGARVVATPQAADGRYNVIGAEDRKLYQNVRYAGGARTGLVSTPTLYGEAGTELVIDAPTLRRLNMKAPSFNSWVMANRVPQRAGGNYESVAQGATNTDNTSLLRANLAATAELIGLVSDLKRNGVKAPIVLDELEAKQALRDMSIKKGSING